MTDIVERLRSVGYMGATGDFYHPPTCREAADEIERLRGLLLQFIEYVEQDTEWPDIVAEGRAALGVAPSQPSSTSPAQPLDIGNKSPRLRST